MPLLIEELPVTQTTRVTHGWAYVPDTGVPIAAVQPGNRKRARDAHNNASISASATARQQKAIQQRLNDLEKENYRDNVQISIPRREGGGGRDKSKKVSVNVRRILQYSRTFQHYLADEEAALAAGGGGIGGMGVGNTGLGTGLGGMNTGNASLGGGGTPKMSTSLQLVDSASKNKQGVVKVPAKRGPKPKKLREAAAAAAAAAAAENSPTPKSTKASPSIKKDPEASTRQSLLKDVDTEMTDAPAETPTRPLRAEPTVQTSTPAAQDQSSSTAASTATTQKPQYDPMLDQNPLLKTLGLPKAPSDRVMKILLSEPPLTWNAARAKTLIDSDDATNAVGGGLKKPPRHFCAICGYWGKIKCRRCGERVCGLMECWRGHEAVCAVVAY